MSVWKMKRHIGLVLAFSVMFAVTGFQRGALFAAHLPEEQICDIQQNCETPNSTINGFKYYDENRNGSFDDEPLLGEWVITLYDSQWQPIHQTLSDDDGTFQISISLGDDPYYLCEENRAEWLQMEPVTLHYLEDGNSSCYRIEDEISPSYPFGNIHKSDITNDLVGGQIIGITNSATPKEPQNQGEVLGERVLAETGYAALTPLISSVTIISIALILAVLSKRQSF